MNKIKHIFNFSIKAAVAGMICCVGPMALFATGLVSGVWAISFADFFYNEDGGANLYGWLLRGGAALIVVYGIYKYNRKENCSVNTPQQRRTNKIIVGVTMALLALSMFFALERWSSKYFNDNIVPAQQEELTTNDYFDSIPVFVPKTTNHDSILKILTLKQAYIMVRRGTEERNSSPLNKEQRSGVYLSPATGDTLFLSRDKFDSGTGWPSFDSSTDNVSLGPREQGGWEVIEKSNGYHLGHLFKGEDFTPKSMRYCINGAALIFKSNQ